MSLQIGKHPARAVSAALGKSSKGNEQVAIEYLFVDGPNKGQSVTFYGTFTPDAEQFAFEALRNSGFRGDDLTDLSSLSGPQTPVVQLVLGEEEWNGKAQIKVKFVNKMGGAALKNPLSAEDTKSFAEKMKARLQGFDRSQGAPRPAAQAASAPAAAAPVAATEDVPF